MNPRDYSIEKACSFCGISYENHLGYCHPQRHWVFVTDCPGLEDKQFATEAECVRAIEDECADAADWYNHMRQVAREGTR